MGVFSDRARVWVLPLLVALLAADVGLWMWVSLTHDGSYLRCMDPEPGEPVPCVGEELVLPLQRVIVIHGPDRYEVGRVEGQIDVLGSTAGLELGEEITVGGVRTEDGLQAAFVEDHPLRPWKRRLGQLGILVVGALVLAAFTLRRTTAGLRVVPRG